MDSIIGSYSVTYKGAKAGELRIFKNGTYFIFSFRSDVFYTDILRLICISGEVFIPIGIPIPDGNSLFLQKQFTRNYLSSIGISSIDSAVLLPASEKLPVKTAPAKNDLISKDTGSNSEWTQEHEPWLLFNDEELKNACSNISGALRKDTPDSTLLAVPISSSEPFPMMPIFCFGEAQFIDSKQYVVFTIKNGQLV